MKWLNSGVVDPWLGIPQAVPRQGIERGIRRHQWRPLCYTMQAVKRQEDTATPQQTTVSANQHPEIWIDAIRSSA